MTAEQEAFVVMLEDAGFIPNLTMIPNTEDWELVEIEAHYRGNQVTLTFNPDGKLIEVDY